MDQAHNLVVTILLGLHSRVGKHSVLRYLPEELLLHIADLSFETIVDMHNLDHHICRIVAHPCLPNQVIVDHYSSYRNQTMPGIVSVWRDHLSLGRIRYKLQRKTDENYWSQSWWTCLLHPNKVSYVIGAYDTFISFNKYNKTCHIDEHVDYSIPSLNLEQSKMYINDYIQKITWWPCDLCTPQIVDAIMREAVLEADKLYTRLQLKN